jgi:hypothetical protein
MFLQQYPCSQVSEQQGICNKTFFAVTIFTSYVFTIALPENIRLERKRFTVSNNISKVNYGRKVL